MHPAADQARRSLDKHEDECARIDPETAEPHLHYGFRREAAGRWRHRLYVISQIVEPASS